MGKKRKFGVTQKVDGKDKKDVGNLLDDKNIESKKVKKVKQNDPNAENSTGVFSSSVILSVEENTNKNNKIRNNKPKNKQKINPPEDEDYDKSVGAHENPTSKKPTKIGFVNDEAQVVATAVSQQSVEKKNHHNLQHNEGDEVNDEDIDKFCDELTEEDNVQFDNWVKLIEAKLHSKKDK